MADHPHDYSAEVVVCLVCHRTEADITRTPCHWTRTEIEYRTDCGQIAFPVSTVPDGKCNGCGRQIAVSVLPSQP